MLSKATLILIAAVVRDSEGKEVSEAKLTEHISSDAEVTLDVPTTYTQKQFDELNTNRFNEGKKANTEILVKDLKAKYSLSFDGKTIDGFLTAFKASVKVEFDKDPDDRVKTLETDLELVRKELTSANTDHGTEVAGLQGQLRSEKNGTEILGLLPDNMVISKPDVMSIFRTGYEVTEEDDKRVIKDRATGDIMKSDTREILSLKDVLSNFVDTRKFRKTGVNGEGDDEGGGGSTKFKTMDELNAHALEKKWEHGGPEYMKALAESRKNPEFVKS